MSPDDLERSKELFAGAFQLLLSASRIWSGEVPPGNAVAEVPLQEEVIARLGFEATVGTLTQVGAMLLSRLAVAEQTTPDDIISRLSTKIFNYDGL